MAKPIIFTIFCTFTQIRRNNRQRNPFTIGIPRPSSAVTDKIYSEFFEYSNVPNRRVERNERAGGKILKKH